MRTYKESDIFIRMDKNSVITTQIRKCVLSISNENIMNNMLEHQYSALRTAYKQTIVMQVIEAIKTGGILLIHMPVDKRLPAFMPYVKVKRNGRDTVIVDISKYVTVGRTPDGKIGEARVDIVKLYNLVVPAYLALYAFVPGTVFSTETTKHMAYMWGKTFTKILVSQRMFVGSKDAFECFMYFAMKFFMTYYLDTPGSVIDKICLDYIGGTKSNYILAVEDKMKVKDIPVFSDWVTFVTTMFSNDITNIKGGAAVEMSIEYYLSLFGSYMGREGSYLAFWSADYFLYCLFVTFNKAYILNDRAWQNIVLEDSRTMTKLLVGLFKEVE